MFDLTAFSKYDLKGKNVHFELQKLCTANIKNEPCKTTYTQMLNEDGGIETDLTVVCITKEHFRVITSAANRERDKFHILRHLSNEINFKDVSDDIACFGLFGPKSRDLLQRLIKEDISKDSIDFASFKKVHIDNIDILAQRLSYVGENGFELYMDINNSKKIFNLIYETGKEFNLSLCGMHALDTMRMETGFLHWGHDISPEENQYQAGLNFAISFKKNIDFIGKDSLSKIKDKTLDKRMMMFTLKESKPGEPLLLHDEPIYLEDKIIGRTTSGNYSFCFNKNLSFGYVNSGNTKETLKDKKIYIEVEKKKYPAEILEKPLNQKNFRN